MSEISAEQIMNALKNCYDPEIPVNIVDLGLVYDVKVNEGEVFVKMTLTAKGCPAHSFISENVKREVQKIPGVKSTQVEVVWEPPWSPEKMSEAAKKQLGYATEPKAPVTISEDMKPLKKGKVVNQPDGTLVLMNDNSQSYRVSQEVISFWEMCDGSKNIAELTDAISQKMKSDIQELKPQVMELVSKLIEGDLIKT